MNPPELSISQLLQGGKLSQVLYNVNNQKNLLFGGQALDPRRPITLYQVWKPLSLRFAANPSDPTLRQVAEHLLQLSDTSAQTILNNLGGSLPVITGPSNQSINVGQTATFSVSVTGSGPFVYQWFRGGIAVLGATSSSLSVPNAQLSDSGSTFFVAVTGAAGTQVSNTATLTVTANLVGFYYQGGTDFSTQLLAGTDAVPYLGTFNITTGQPLLVTFPDLVSTEFIVVKYPATETTKTNYLNPPPSGPDAGGIPSIALEGTSFGGWKYIFSRQNNPFGVNGINGQVRFS